MEKLSKANFKKKEMAESEEKRELEFDGMQETEGKEEGNEILSNSQLPNTPSMSELNLLLVMLSTISFSRDDCMESERPQNVKNKVEGKACISRFQTKRREIHETKIMRRPTEKFHTTIKDCRYFSFVAHLVFR